MNSNYRYLIELLARKEIIIYVNKKISFHEEKSFSS